MKKNLFLGILLFFLVSCGRNIIEKPKKLLSESQMEALMYDLAILEAAKNTDFQLFDSIKFNIKEEIYKKYKIDSVSLAENMVYYASFPQKYNNIIINVENLLKKERDSIEKAIPNAKDPELNIELLDTLK